MSNQNNSVTKTIQRVSVEENNDLIGQNILFQKQKSFTGHLNFMGRNVIPNLTQLETFQRNQSSFIKITSKMAIPGAYQSKSVIPNPSIPNNSQPIQSNPLNNKQKTIKK